MRSSPKNSTAVTDSTIAHVGLTSRSRKIGRASIAAAFTRSSVTRSQCGLFKTCKACNSMLSDTVSSSEVRLVVGPLYLGESHGWG